MKRGVIEPTVKKSRLWIPEGVDKTFLSALPWHLKKEVLGEQWRLLRERPHSLQVKKSSNMIKKRCVRVKECLVEVDKSTTDVNKVSVNIKKIYKQRINSTDTGKLSRTKTKNCDVHPKTFHHKTTKPCKEVQKSNHETQDYDRQSVSSNAKSLKKTKIQKSSKDSWASLDPYPKTVKQRISNAYAYEERNKGHEDDIFDKEDNRWDGQLLRESYDFLDTAKNIELEDHLNSPCGKSPIHPATAAGSEVGTPEVLRPGSPSPRLATLWQRAAFLQRKIRERDRRSGKGRKSKEDRSGENSGSTLTADPKKIVFSELAKTVKIATAEEEGEDLDLSGAEGYYSDDYNL